MLGVYVTVPVACFRTEISGRLRWTHSHDVQA